MPTLADLKIALERALQDPYVNAETYARPLRKAKLITTGGRGSSAPQITPRDATNLLISMLGHAPAIKGPETVKRYRSLSLQGRPPGKLQHNTDWPQRSKDMKTYPLAYIEKVSQFGTVVELLIWRLADGPIGDVAEKWKGGPLEPGLSIRFIGPKPTVVVHAPMLNEFVQRTLVYGRKADTQPSNRSGIERASVIHEDVLMAIARLFQNS